MLWRCVWGFTVEFPTDGGDLYRDRSVALVNKMNERDEEGWFSAICEMPQELFGKFIHNPSKLISVTRIFSIAVDGRSLSANFYATPKPQTVNMSAQLS